MLKWGLKLVTYLAERYTLVERTAGEYEVKVSFEQFHEITVQAERSHIASRALALYNEPRLGWYQRVLDGDTPIVSVQVKKYNLISADAKVDLNTRWHRPKSDREEHGIGAKRLTIKM